jgi:hypothetical protein
VTIDRESNNRRRDSTNPALRVGSILLLAVMVHGSISVGAVGGGAAPSALVHRLTLEGRVSEAVKWLAMGYGHAEGRLVSYQQMKEEGRTFFALKNPYTGADLQEACSADAESGSVCIRLVDIYSGALEMRGKDGETLVLGDVVPLNRLDLPRSAREKPNPTVAKAMALGYTDTQIKLLHLRMGPRHGSRSLCSEFRGGSRLR